MSIASDLRPETYRLRNTGQEHNRNVVSETNHRKRGQCKLGPADCLLSNGSEE
jgi:hypothetical protein